MSKHISYMNVKSVIREDSLSVEGLSLCLQLSGGLSKDNVITGPSFSVKMSLTLKDLKITNQS